MFALNQINVETTNLRRAFENYRENDQDSKERLNFAVMRVISFMGAIGFALLGIASLATYPADESLPLMFKLSGLSLLFMICHNTIKQADETMEELIRREV